MFGPDVEAAIHGHAMAAYPHESCGIVRNGIYEPMVNNDPDPANAFDFERAVLTDPAVQAIVHSHPDGPLYPSALDMEQQLAMDIPWGLVMTNGEYCEPTLWWGPGVAMPPLVGRGFRHGPSGSDGRGDCYALVKDWYKIHRGLDMVEVPRDHEWWAKGQDLYTAHLQPQRFREITIEQLQPGDGVLMHVLATVPNHAGIYLGNGLILHHLPNRLSREEPLMRWRHLVTHFLRPPPAPEPNVLQGGSAEGGE